MVSADSDNLAHGSYYVRATDVDLYFMTTIPYYFSMIQEMAAAHTTLKGIGIEGLYRDYKLTWVIARARINFVSHPRWMDQIELISWAQQNVRLNCPRVVRGYAGNELLFDAMTIWGIIDPMRKRPVRPQPILEILGTADPAKHYADPALPRLPEWDETEKLEMLPALETRPYFYDVDVNGHVNNVMYLHWIINALGRSFLSGHEVEMIDVKWEKQTYAEDEVTVETALTGKKDGICSFIHRIRNENGVTVFSGASEWRERRDKFQALGKEL